MKFTEFHTDRLVLTKISPEVVDFVYQNFSDDEIIAFFGLESNGALAVEKEKYNAGLSTFNKTFLYFTLTDNKNGKVIGWCGYHTWFTNHNRAEMGYALYNDNLKRQGIMSEALSIILPYGFKTMKLHRIEALTATYNTASINTLAKFGFKREGVLREHYFINNKMEDSVMFSLLQHEYNTAANIF